MASRSDVHRSGITLQYQYSVYGLTLHSAVELPGLSTGGSEPDVVVETGRVPTRLPGARHTALGQQVTPDEVLIPAGSRGRILVTGGRRVTIQAGKGAAMSRLRPYISGSAMGAVLHQRGTLALHASAAVADDGVVAFLGRRGAGKSTLVAMLHERGYPVVADDVCALSMRGGKFHVHPGPMMLKLDGAALERLSGVEADPLPAANGRKRACSSGIRFAATMLPLTRIFVLHEDDKPSVSQPSPATAVQMLRRFTYRRRLMAGNGRRREHFGQCVELQRASPLRIVRRTNRWSDAPALIALIEEELGRNKQES